VLGRLSGEGLLGGSMGLDAAAARAALEPVADRLGFGVERAAHGIVAIVVSNMVRAIRGISVERGLDPRRFALLAFGGAAPCTPPTWPAASASARSSFRRRPASSARKG
jgi:N-methylhydantoinase A